MNDLKVRALFIVVVKNFLVNRRAKNYKDLVEKLLKSLQDIGANMTIKFHFYIAILINFRIIAAMWLMSKENDSIRISK